MPECFVIMPISTPTSSLNDYDEDPDHFKHVLECLFEPALNDAGYDMVPPSILNSQVIQAEIIRRLETADLVLCDISGWNANVFFELGIRVALDRPVALVKDTRTPIIPFDNTLVSCHTYDAKLNAWDLKREVKGLAKFIRSAGAQDRNALWKYFGITQRAGLPSTGDLMQDKLDLILTALQRTAADPTQNKLDQILTALQRIDFPRTHSAGPGEPSLGPYHHPESVFDYRRESSRSDDGEPLRNIFYYGSAEPPLPRDDSEPRSRSAPRRANSAVGWLRRSLGTK